MTSLALAHVAGALLLKYDTAPTTIDARARATLRDILEKLERNARGNVTILHRYLLLELDKMSAEYLWTEIHSQWQTHVRTTCNEFLAFLATFFKVWGTTSFRRPALERILRELDRVADGLPMRYQELFFELSAAMQQYGEDVVVDLQGLSEALELQQYSFPPLPPTAISGTRLSTSEKREGNVADEGVKDDSLEVAGADLAPAATDPLESIPQAAGDETGEDGLDVAPGAVQDGEGAPREEEIGAAGEQVAEHEAEDGDVGSTTEEGVLV